MKSRYSSRLRVIAATLVASFSIMDFAWAIDLRTKLQEDQLAWELLSQGRKYDSTQSNSALDNTTQFESMAAGEIASQNDLANLESLNQFTLTTQNDDLIQYIGNTVQKITRPDGTVLTNIELNSDQTIKRADLRLGDGSFQVYENGQVVQYSRPDGTVLRYQNGVLISETSADGSFETLYSIDDSSGNTIADNPETTIVFDADGKLISIYKKSDETLVEFEAGFLSKVTTPTTSVEYSRAQIDGKTVVKVQSSGGQTSSDQVLDESGNEYYFDGNDIVAIKTSDGVTLKDLEWGDEGELVRYKNRTLADGTQIFYEYEAESIVSITVFDDQNAEIFAYEKTSEEAKTIRKQGEEWNYTNDLLVSYSDSINEPVFFIYEENVLSEIHQYIGGVLHIYNTDRALIRTESDSEIITYRIDDAFQGYADTKYIKSTQQTFKYSYTKDSENHIQATQSLITAFPITSYTDDYYGSNYLDHTTYPSTEISFNFSDKLGNSPYAYMQGYNYVPNDKYIYLTAYFRESGIQVTKSGYDYIQGQYINETKHLDYTIDISETYNARMEWVDGSIQLVMKASSGTEEVVHQELQWDWDPKFSIYSLYMPIQVVSTSHGSDWKQAHSRTANILDKNKSYDANFTLDTGSYTHYLKYDWNINGRQISMTYQESSKRFYFSSKYYDASLGRYVYDLNEYVSYEIKQGVGYKSRLKMTDQGLQIFFWEESDSIPSQPLYTLSQFVSDTYYHYANITGGSYEVYESSDIQALEAPLVSEHSRIEDHRYDWTFVDGVLTGISTPSNGIVSILRTEGVITGYLKNLNGMTISYDANGVPITGNKGDSTFEFFTEGAYSGYIKSEYDSAENQQYLYEYTIDPQGNVEAIRSAEKPLDWIYTNQGINGSAYVDYESDPEVGIHFNFENAINASSYAEISAYHYTSGVVQHSVYVYAYQSNIQFNHYIYDYVTGQSTTDNHVIDYAFDPSAPYDLFLRWESGVANLYARKDGSSEELLYSLQDASWNPRLSAGGSRLPVEIISHPEDRLSLQQQFQSRKYTETLGASGSFEFDSTSSNTKKMEIRTYGTYEGKTSNLTFYYNVYNGSFYPKMQVWDPSQGRYVYTYGDPVQHTLSYDTQYEYKAIFNNGAFEFYIWESGEAKPSEPIISFEEFQGDNFEVQTYFYGGTGEANVYEDYRELITPIQYSLWNAQSEHDFYMNLMPANYSLSKPDPSTAAMPLPEGYPHELRYDSEGGLTDVFLDMRHYEFENGVLTSVTDSESGNTLSLNQDISFLGNITSVALNNGDIQTEYDQNGRLKTVMYAGTTIHYKAETDEIQYIETASGNEIYDPIFENGQIVSAQIYDVEGNLRIYSEGRLERLVRADKNAYAFDIEGNILQWLTPEGLSYDFNYTADDSILAVLDEFEAPSIPDTAIKTYQFDSGLNLQKMIRHNEDIINFTDDQKIHLIEYADEQDDQSFDYLPNEQVLVTQGNTVTLYDDNNNPLNTKITQNDGSQLDIIYQYGKIRSVKKDGNLLFKYSYEFDDSGSEYTIVEDLTEKQLKRYINNQLINSVHTETRVLSEYTYDENNRVKNVAISRLGRQIHAYDYAYDGSNTIVTDENAVERHYNEERELVKLVKDGYVYTYSTQTSRTQTLKAVIPDLSANDAADLLNRSKWADISELSFISEFELDSSGRLLNALTVHGEYFEFTHLTDQSVEVIQSESGTPKYKLDLTYNLTGKLEQVLLHEAVENKAVEALVSQGIAPQVSSSDSGNISDADRITDGVWGDTDLGWVGADPAGADTVTVDLGAAQNVTRIIYDTRSAYLGDSVYQEEFEISYSEDGVVWQSAYDAHGLTEAGIQEMSVDIQARYIRVDGIKTVDSEDAAFKNAYLAELQVFSTPPSTWSWKDIKSYSFTYDGQERIQTATETTLQSGAVTQSDVTDYEYQKIITEELVSRTLSDGSVVRYSAELGGAGDVDSIEYPDGRIITDVILDKARNIQSATITDSVTGKKTLYKEGEILAEIYPDGREMYYQSNRLIGFMDAELGLFGVSYKEESNQVTETVLTRDNLELHYGADYTLQYAKFLNITDPDAIAEGVEHSYEGGYGGRFSVDGDFETAQKDQRRHYSGGMGDVTSILTLPELQTIDTLIYKMTAFGEAHGDYIKDYSAYVEVEVLVNGVWELVEGTAAGVKYAQGDGKETVDTGIVTLTDLNIDNVEAVRAHARGFGNSSDNANANGGAAIYELQFTVKDQSILTAAYEGSVLTLNGYQKSAQYDSAGNYLNTGNDVVDQTASEIAGIAHLIQELPYSENQNIALPDDFDAIYKTTSEAVLAGNTIMRQEYSSDGIMEVQTKADKTVTLYEDNKPTFVYDEFGTELIRHEYDSEGNIARVHLTNAREVLPKQIRATRSRIYLERRNSLLDLAEQKGLAIEQIQTDSEELRIQVQSHLDYWQRQADTMSNLEVRGKEARQAVAKVVGQMEDAVDQLQGQVDQINQQEADAYAKLDEDVRKASDKIDEDTQMAFMELYRQKKELEEQITRQEISPVIYDVYRRLLGRDPTSDEYQFWIDRTDFQTGEVFYDESLAELQKEPLASSLYFNGQDSALSVSPDASLEFGSGDFTIDFWANFMDQNSNQSLLDLGGDGGLQVFYRLKDAGRGEVVVSIAGEEYSVEWTPDTSVFHHLALVRDQGIIKIFINGERVLKSPSEDIVNDAGEFLHYVFDEEDSLEEVQVTIDGKERRYTPEGYLKREQLADGTTKHYGYIFDDLGKLKAVKVTERTAVAIDGILPPFDSQTGRFLRLSALSGGYLDGFTSALYANDQGIGSGNYNYFRASGERWMARGIDVAIVDANGELVKSDMFDTYTSTSESDRLAAFLEGVEPGHYAVFAASDEASDKLNERAKLAIEAFGSSKIRDLGFRQSWAMIGRKGAAAGSAIEQLNPMGKGSAEVSNYQTKVGYFDATGNPIRFSQFQDIPNVNWSSTHGYDSNENFESLGDLPDGRTAGFFKNFHEDEPLSGFYNLSDDINSADPNKLLYASFVDEILKTTQHAKDKIVFYDTRYKEVSVNHSVVLNFANKLKENGFVLMNADELAEFLDQGGEDSAVVFATGLIPDNIYNRDFSKNLKTTDKIRPYLERGGTFVWTTDSPFFNVGDNSGNFKVVGEIGMKDVLGVTPIYSRSGLIYRDMIETHEFNSSDSMFYEVNYGPGLSFDNGDMVLGYSEDASGSASSAGTTGSDTGTSTYTDTYLDTYTDTYTDSSTDPYASTSYGPTLVKDNRQTGYGVLPLYKVNFRSGDGSEGFEVGLTGKNWGYGQTQMTIRHEDGKFNVYYQDGGAIRLVASMDALVDTEYTAEFALNFKTLSVQVYPTGSQVPETPLYITQDDWLYAGLMAGVQQGQVRIRSVEFKKRGGEYVSPKAVVTPDDALDGDESPLDWESLTYDIGTNQTDLSGFSQGLTIGASDVDGYGNFDGYLEEFRISKRVARFRNHFIKPSVRYLPDEFTSLLIRSGMEDLESVQDYSLNAHAVTESGALGYSTSVYKFEKSFLGGLSDTSSLTFPGPTSYFDGVNGYITAKNNSNINVARGDWSSDFWINPDELGRKQTVFSQGGDQSNSAALSILEDGSVQFEFMQNGSLAIDLKSSVKINAGEWSHVALSQHGQIWRIYVDGKEVAKTTITTPLQRVGESLEIGRNGTLEGLDKEYFNGYLDEFRFSTTPRFVYNFTPSRNEVTNMWGTALLLRESFFSETVFQDAGWNKTTLEFEDGVYPDDHHTPLMRPETKNLDLVITEFIEDSQELYQRTAYVETIKGYVSDAINRILNDFIGSNDRITDEGKDVMSELFGIAKDQIVDITGFDLRKVDTYIQSRSLHFGQSAFLSLEALFDQKGIHYAREDLATHAIMIDILAGIISPLDDGDLVLSMFALQTVAESAKISDTPLDLTAMNLSWDDLLKIFEANPNAKVVAHISGNHFVIVTSIEEDRITYTDPGIGKDKENEILTISKEGFLKEWQGNVLTHATNSDVILSAGEAGVEGSRLPLDENSQARELTLDETQSIRGAFWGSMLNIFASILAIALAIPSGGLSLAGAMWSPAVIGLRIASFVASAIEGDWMQAISTAVTVGLSWGFSEGGFLTNLFSGAQPAAEGTVLAGGEIVKTGAQSVGFFGQIFQSVSGFLSPVFNGFQAVFDWIPGVSSITLGNFTQTVVGIGLNYGISAGLDALGVDPQIAGFASNLISGAILGAVDPKSGEVLKGAEQLKGVSTNLYQTITFSDMGRLGHDLGWDAEFTQLASLSLGAIQGNLISHPENTLKDVFKDIGPQFTSSFTSYGIGKLGESFGLDPRISSLISTPLSGVVGAFSTGGDQLGKNIIDAVNSGLIRRATDLAISYVVDQSEIDPLFGALSANIISGGVLGIFNRDGNILQGVYDSLKKSVLSVFNFGSNTIDINSPNYTFARAQYLAKIQDFSSKLSQIGLEATLENYATQIFTRDAIENIWKQGGIADFISGQATSTEYHGELLTRLRSGGFDLYLDPSSDEIVGRSYLDPASNTRIDEFDGRYGFDEFGNFGLIDGKRVSEIADGVVQTQTISNGAIISIVIESNGIKKSLIARDENGLVYNQTTGKWTNYILDDQENGSKIVVGDGKIESMNIESEDGKIAIASDGTVSVEIKDQGREAELIDNAARLAEENIKDLNSDNVEVTDLLSAALSSPAKNAEDLINKLANIGDELVSNSTKMQVVAELNKLRAKFEETGIMPDIEVIWKKKSTKTAPLGLATHEYSTGISQTIKGNLGFGKIVLDLFSDEPVISFGASGKVEALKYETNSGIASIGIEGSADYEFNPLGAQLNLFNPAGTIGTMLYNYIMNPSVDLGVYFDSTINANEQLSTQHSAGIYRTNANKTKISNTNSVEWGDHVDFSLFNSNVTTLNDGSRLSRAGYTTLAVAAVAVSAYAAAGATEAGVGGYLSTLAGRAAVASSGALAKLMSSIGLRLAH